MEATHRTYTIEVFRQKFPVHVEPPTSLIKLLEEVFAILHKNHFPRLKVTVRELEDETTLDEIDNQKLKAKTYINKSRIQYDKFVINLKSRRVSHPKTLSLGDKLNLQNLISQCSLQIAEHLTPRIYVGYHIFNSPIYEAYASRIKAFILDQLASNPSLNEYLKNPPSTSVSLLKSLICIATENGNNPSQRHKQFLILLRGLIHSEYSSEYDVAVNTFIRNIVDFLMSKIYMVDIWENFFATYTPEVQILSTRLSEIIDSYSYSLYSKFEKCGPGEKLADMYLRGDMPTFLCDFEIGNIRINFHRTPNITTKEEGKVTFDIISEAKDFLSRTSEKTLLLSFMNRQGVDQANEKERCVPIQVLDTLPNVSVMFLDRMGEFASQIGNFDDTLFPQVKQSTIFKSLFLDQHFNIGNEHSEFFYSQKTQSDWNVKVKVILDKVHEHYFQNASTLSHNERCEFNDIANYVIVREYLKFHPAQRCYMFCFASVDRDPTFYVGFFAFLMMSERIELTHARKRWLMTILFTPCLMMFSRIILDFFLSRLKSSLERMQNCPPFPKDIDYTLKGE
jgi:hypothetical protein